jgi:RNA polymerase sigma-70 factor (ECF subfamily)
MDKAQPEEAAFRLVIAHRSMLKAYVNALIRDPVLAEDTFSDVILNIVRSWDRFDPEKPFAVWARGVAYNVAMVNLRREGRQKLLIDGIVLEWVGDELDKAGDEALLARRQLALSHCLDKLSSAEQRLLHLRYFENLSYQDIAEDIGKRVGSVYTVFSRLHRMLSRCVARQEESL